MLSHIHLYWLFLDISDKHFFIIIIIFCKITADAKIWKQVWHSCNTKTKVSKSSNSAITIFKRMNHLKLCMDNGKFLVLEVKLSS